jgi:hypothetical protein
VVACLIVPDVPLNLCIIYAGLNKYEYKPGKSLKVSLPTDMTDEEIIDALKRLDPEPAKHNKAQKTAKG